MYTLMAKRELQDQLKCKLGAGIGEVSLSWVKEIKKRKSVTQACILHNHKENYGSFIP